MNDMIIRFKWKPEDVGARRSLAWQRKYVAEHIQSALLSYISRIKIDKAFIEDVVVIGYDDLKSYPPEMHDEILTNLDCNVPSFVEYYAKEVEASWVPDDIDPAAELEDIEYERRRDDSL
jgi:hypothetical protein